MLIKNLSLGAPQHEPKFRMSSTHCQVRGLTLAAVHVDMTLYNVQVQCSKEGNDRSLWTDQRRPTFNTMISLLIGFQESEPWIVRTSKNLSGPLHTVV